MQNNQLYSLEEIADMHSLVLIDNCILSCACKSGENKLAFGDISSNTLPISERLFSRLYEIIKSRKNIQAIPEVREEFSGLIKIAANIHNVNARNIKKVESYAKNSGFSELGVANAMKNMAEMRKILEKLDGIKRRLSGREQIVNEEVYNAMLSQAVEIAKNIHMFSTKPKHLLKAQKLKITDEKIVASAFAYSAQRKGNVAIVSNDTRIPVLARGMYYTLFAEELSPSNLYLVDAIMDNELNAESGVPIEIYSDNDFCRHGFNRFCAKGMKAAPVRLNDLYHKTLENVRSIEELIPERQSRAI